MSDALYEQFLLHCTSSSRRIVHFKLASRNILILTNRIIFFFLSVCFSLSALSVYGRPEHYRSEIRYHFPRNPIHSPQRILRQSNWYPNGNGEDYFSGLDPMTGNNNNENTSVSPNNPNINGNQNYEQPTGGDEYYNNDRQTSTVANRPTRPRPSDRPNQVATSTTPSNNNNSAVLNSCNSECKTRTVMEYNPVCGSNEITYQNVRFLRCVADCSQLRKYTEY